MIPHARFAQDEETQKADTCGEGWLVGFVVRRGGFGSGCCGWLCPLGIGIAIGIGIELDSSALGSRYRCRSRRERRGFTGRVLVRGGRVGKFRRPEISAELMPRLRFVFRGVVGRWGRIRCSWGKGFCRPSRGWLCMGRRNPALTRWAIVYRPSGPAEVLASQSANDQCLGRGERTDSGGSAHR